MKIVVMSSASLAHTGVLTAMCGTKLHYGFLAASFGHVSGVQADA